MRRFRKAQKAARAHKQRLDHILSSSNINGLVFISSKSEIISSYLPVISMGYCRRPGAGY
jgi:hypothetical protein